MAYTQAQLDKLEAAIAIGALRVESNGDMVIYRSLEEMIRVRDLMRAELGVSPSTQSRGRAWRPATSTGLGCGDG